MTKNLEIEVAKNTDIFHSPYFFATRAEHLYIIGKWCFPTKNPNDSMDVSWKIAHLCKERGYIEPHQLFCSMCSTRVEKDEINLITKFINLTGLNVIIPGKGHGDRSS